MTSSSIVEIPYQIALALSLASHATGTEFDYLLKTAARESNFHISAKAKGSSAAGLFQFVEGTWLRTVKEEGEKFGLGAYAKRIFRSRSGRYYVPDADDRRRILALRNDPKVAAMMAGVFARRNSDFMAVRIGRKPSSGELYIAHFLGPSDAVRLVKLRRTKPYLNAAAQFPVAASYNSRLFYRSGRALSVEELYQRLVHKHARPTGVRISRPHKVGGWQTTIVAASDYITGRVVSASAPKRARKAASKTRRATRKAGSSTPPALSLRGSLRP